MCFDYFSFKWYEILGENNDTGINLDFNFNL